MSRPSSNTRPFLWILQASPVSGQARPRRTRCQPQQSLGCQEAEYLASLRLWGGLNHRLSEFLPAWTGLA